MNHTIEKIEKVILQNGTRGMDIIKEHLTSGYCQRSAELIIKAQNTVLIGTGFPAAGSFETDGPVGAIALYKVLETLNYKPVFVCAPPIFNALKTSFRTYEFPILSWHESEIFAEKALAELNPSLIISIERAGRAADNKYYNMRKVDISSLVSKFDLFLDLSPAPSIAIGDGGNEIGMGNIYEALSGLNIIPSVTNCTELVIAAVSNWGAYGIIAALSILLKQDLFLSFHILEIMDFLISSGSVDGINHRAEYTEDGFPIKTGMDIAETLQQIVCDEINKIG